MSDVQIALVAEGPTDKIILEASLKAFLPFSFVLTLLQPEKTKPDLGTGWGGVLKWCLEIKRRGVSSLEQDPLLSRFDLIFLHLDLDVAHKKYEDCGLEVTSLSVQLGILPCAQSCPPPDNTRVPLIHVLQSWLGPVQFGAKSVLFLPAQSSGAWLAAATLPDGHNLLNGLECNVNAETSLEGLPRNLKIKKGIRHYTNRAPDLTRQWSRVKLLCTQALLLEEEVLRKAAMI